MARQIIVLATRKGNNGTDFVIEVAYWLATPATLVRADASRVSAVPSAAPWSCTAAELAALQAGTVTEVLDAPQLPGPVAAIESALVTRYQAAQAALDARAVAHNYAGSSWDGTTWTLT